jgi:hypothetical protein
MPMPRNVSQGPTGVSRLTLSELTQRLLTARRDIDLALEQRPDSPAAKDAQGQYLVHMVMVVDALRECILAEYQA